MIDVLFAAARFISLSADRFETFGRLIRGSGENFEEECKVYFDDLRCCSIDFRNYLENRWKREFEDTIRVNLDDV